MRAVDGRAVLRGQGLLRWSWEAHVVVVLLQRWQGWWLLSIPHLGLLLLFAALSSLHDLGGPILVCRVVEKCANVVHEQWIKKLGDFLFVGKIQSPFKRYPVLMLVQGRYSYLSIRHTRRLSSALVQS